MSKLSFRARALDASKPMPIYMAEELPDLPDYSAINRAVPQMPSGMEKEEECEHHLQRAICAGLIIPTPEVSDIPDKDFYDKIYPANYKQPRQLIHMQPFTMEQDIPDYDMDSEDERWLQSQAQRLELSPLKFEEMMDRLEKSSGQTVVTLNEAKALLKEDDDLIIAVFDYWLNKRLKTQHPLILTVKTEQRAGIAANNPYLAFRRRTEKMQTRKNRKNDETSYEKMLKLRRDLCRAVTLLELVKKREKMKREHVHLTIEIFEKRFQIRDFNGAIYAEAAAIKTSRPAFTPIFHNHYSNQNWANNKPILKDEVIPRKEKRQYKKRKHKSLNSHTRTGSISGSVDSVGVLSSDDESMVAQLSPTETEEIDDEGQFAFRRNKLCSYHMPLPIEGNWPWCSKEENGLADKRFRFTLTSLSNPRRCIGFARRRIGRGGRVILDRIGTDHDDFWRTLDFSIIEPNKKIKKCPSITTLIDDNSINNDNNFISNNDNNNLNVNSTIRTDIKSDDFSSFDHSKRTTNLSDFPNESDNINVKVEIDDDSGVGGRRLAYNNNINNNNSNNIDNSSNDNIVNTTPSVARTKQEEEDMIEILRSIQRDWLHFRPKTPPADYEPPCHMLPASDNYFIPNVDTTFSIELQPLESSSNTLLDSSTFLTDPFNFDNNIDSLIDVPVTDTRQSSSSQSQLQSQQQQQQSSDRIVQTGINLNVNVGLNTLNCSNVNNDSVYSNLNNINDCIKFNDNNLMILDEDVNDKRTIIGCSRFRVSDLNQCSNVLTTTTTTCATTVTTTTALTSATTTTTTSKLINNISTTINTSTTSPILNNINSGSDGKILTIATTNRHNSDNSSLSNTNGLLTQFGLDGRTKNNKISYAYSGGVGYSNASSGTLSLHTSAHSLTLNSHSANILEIPITDDNESTTNKLVNSTDTTSPATTNNKTKTIVRKNNLVMEVT